MNQQQLDRIKNGKGFIAALDQSGGSTPKALADYGIPEDAYNNEDEMFDKVHEMRTRIITSPAFDSEKILGAILFEKTMDRKVEGKYTGDYLAEKGIVPFLKVDKGLADKENGVQLMKPINDLDETLRRANERKIFGTKMRSVIHDPDESGIEAVVQQQFDIAKRILASDLMPIVEPEVNIHSEEKEKCEELLRNHILKHLNELEEDQQVMLKLTIPTKTNAYKELVDHPKVIRVVALSGGYEREEANEKLTANDGLIASFSRALVGDVYADQSDETFDQALQNAVDSIYAASIQKGR